MVSVVEQHADAKLDLDEFRARISDTVGARFVELLENPDERDPEIGEQLMGRLVERGADELGSVELSEAYHAQLAEAARLSWADLHAIPFADRGKVFSAAQEFIATWAAQQAYAEDVMVTVMELAEANGKRLGKVRNPADLRGVRNTMQERAKVRAEVGAEKAAQTEPDMESDI